jgi:hypothetical protein
MGEVYRARDTRLGRDVAIKVLPPHLLDSSDALVRFEREARAVATLNHPNILALHDIGREGSISYAVTELLEGETLRVRIAAGPMSPRRALDVLAQVARGLGAAHERGIVHRDIKPENLFLTSDGRVKILDFGVALRAENVTTNADVTTAALTQPGTLVGTPSYMAPEQLLTQVATPRSDLFAFGLVAHEILTGVHPFKRPTVGEMTIAILREEPAALGAVTAALPPGVAPLLARCLEKQPADRPASARDLAFYLETIAGTSDVLADGRQAVRADAVPRIRRRVLATSIALLLPALLVAWVYLGVMGERSVAGAIDADLARAERLVRRVHMERLTRLALSARMIALFPELKALFDTKDAPTVGAFLEEQQNALPGRPTLIALTADGRILARTDTAGGTPAAPGDTWIDQLVAKRGDPAVVSIEGRLHHAAVHPSAAADTVFGYVVAAIPVDEPFAQSLGEATQDEIVLLATGVLASTLRGSQVPWSSLPAWREAGGRADRAMDVRIGSQRFAAREVTLSDQPQLAAIVAKSRDDAVAPFRRMQGGLIAIAIIGIVAAFAGAALMARSITQALLPPS